MASLTGIAGNWKVSEGSGRAYFSVDIHAFSPPGQRALNLSIVRGRDGTHRGENMLVTIIGREQIEELRDLLNRVLDAPEGVGVCTTKPLEFLGPCEMNAEPVRVLSENRTNL